MPPRSDDRGIRELLEAVPREHPPDTLRHRLEADIEARFPEAQRKPVSARRARVWQAACLPLRLLGRRPALAGAAAVLGVCVAIALVNTGSPDLLARVLEAMAEVKTAHVESTSGEQWLSVDSGVRTEGNYGTSVCTSVATWLYDRDAHTVTILHPRPSDQVNALLAALSGKKWIDGCRKEHLPHRISDVVLDGTPAKRLDVEDEDMAAGATVWIDSDSLRILRMRQWREEKGRRVIESEARIEYDIALDPALFTFEPPAGARVVEWRFDEPVRELIKEAMEAVRTLPMHEVGQRARVFRSRGQWFDRWSKWEAWRHNGVGYRMESDSGVVLGANMHEHWYHSDGHGFIEDWNPGYAKCRPPILGWLEPLQRGELATPARHRKEPKVARYEKNGRTLLRIVTYRTDPSLESAERALKHERREYAFDVDAKRIAEYAVYVLVDDEWKPAKRVRYDYPEQLPPGIFDFDPPPGVEIDDRRNR